jgi:hypothetical protein
MRKARQKYDVRMAKGCDAARSHIFPRIIRDESCRRAWKRREEAGMVLAELRSRPSQRDKILPALGNCDPVQFTWRHRAVSDRWLGESGRPIATPSTWFFATVVNPSSAIVYEREFERAKLDSCVSKSTSAASYAREINFSLIFRE